jgi:hypothetical protein
MGLNMAAGVTAQGADRREAGSALDLQQDLVGRRVPAGLVYGSEIALIRQQNKRFAYAE